MKIHVSTDWRIFTFAKKYGVAAVQTCNRWPPRISSSLAKPSELHQPRCSDVSDEGESPLDVLL